MPDIDNFTLETLRDHGEKLAAVQITAGDTKGAVADLAIQLSALSDKLVMVEALDNDNRASLQALRDELAPVLAYVQNGPGKGRFGPTHAGITGGISAVVAGIVAGVMGYFHGRG